MPHIPGSGRTRSTHSRAPRASHEDSSFDWTTSQSEAVNAQFQIDAVYGNQNLLPGTGESDPFTNDVRPIVIVSVLPTLPDTEYPIGAVVSYTVDGKLYRNVLGVWTAVVAGTDIQTGTIPGTALQANTITANQIATDTITANQIAADTITGNEIAAFSITGNEIAADSISAFHLQAGSISADDITTGTLSGVFITGVNIQAGGGGFDGFTVISDGWGFIGEWTSAHLYTSGPIISDNLITTSFALRAPYGPGVGWAPTFGDGLLFIDTASGAAGRIYAGHSGGWHYATMDAGVSIPTHETVCPVCEDALRPGDDLILQGDRYENDGALHALYKHLSCAGKPLGRLADEFWEAERNPTLKERLERIALKLSGVVMKKGSRPDKNQPRL